MKTKYDHFTSCEEPKNSVPIDIGLVLTSDQLSALGDAQKKLAGVHWLLLTVKFCNVACLNYL